jgi:hypothetical protein
MPAQNMIITGSEFNCKDNTTYSKPKVNKSNGKSVGILNKDTKKTLYISTPLMLTWGMNENDFDGRGSKTYDLSLQFPREQDSNYTTETASLLNNLVAFEEMIKADAITNCKEWMNKSKLEPAVVDALWTPMLRYPKDKDTGDYDYTRSPTLRVKIPYYDNIFKMELYDMEGVKVFPSDSDDGDQSPMSMVEKGQNIAVVIQSGGVWFANGKFGTTWRLVQAVIQPRETLVGRCHIQLNASSKQLLKNESEAKANADSVTVKNDVTVYDSDEDASVVKTEAVEETAEEAVEETAEEAVEETEEESEVKNVDGTPEVEVKVSTDVEKPEVKKPRKVTKKKADA